MGSAGAHCHLARRAHAAAGALPARALEGGGRWRQQRGVRAEPLAGSLLGGAPARAGRARLRTTTCGLFGGGERNRRKEELRAQLREKELAKKMAPESELVPLEGALLGEEPWADVNEVAEATRGELRGLGDLKAAARRGGAPTRAALGANAYGGKGGWVGFATMVALGATACGAAVLAGRGRAVVPAAPPVVETYSTMALIPLAPATETAEVAAAAAETAAAVVAVVEGGGSRGSARKAGAHSGGAAERQAAWRKATGRRRGAAPKGADAELPGEMLGHRRMRQAQSHELHPIHPGSDILLRRAAALSFVEMQEAAAADGVQLEPVSGFRSEDEQRQLFFGVKAAAGLSVLQRAAVSAPPGYSEHHTGYALDLTSGEVGGELTEEFDRTRAFRWLQQNAARFHWELSFPRHNKAGVAYEPWHFRFVGDSLSLSYFYQAPAH